jgi:hypothetical protein
VIERDSDGAVELTLEYAAGRWHAEGEGLSLAHSALAELDALILATVAQQLRARRVHVRFDTSRLPSWLRQYQPHYFNYVLTVARGPAPQ